MEKSSTNNMENAEAKMEEAFDSAQTEEMTDEIDIPEFTDTITCGYDTTCKAKMKLVRLFDKICKEKDIQYFAISNVLVSCVHYQRFLPGEADRNWDFGLLRPEYEKLIKVLRKYKFPENIRFYEFLDPKKKCYKDTQTLEIMEEITVEDITFTKVFEIRFLPFDKLPRNTEVRNGFLDTLKEKALMYKTMCYWNSYMACKNGLRQYGWKHFYYGRRNIRKKYQEIQELSASFWNDDDAEEYGRVCFKKTAYIKHDQLFPLQELQLEDMMIPCPRDISPWTPIFDADLDNQVKSIQKADLILLQKFDEVCRKLGIGYFICGGTMLGYMRHGGFIPWDDDVDVAMLREDYDRFLKEAGPYFDDRFFIQTRESDPKIPYLFSKIRLNNTEYITAYNEYRDYHKGLCLDIFPFDYLPNDKKEREEFVEKVILISKEHGRVVGNQAPKRITKPDPRNAVEKAYATKNAKKRAKFEKISLFDTQAAYIKEATKYNATAKEAGLTTVASFVPSYTFIDLEDLLPYQDGEFNGIRVMVPKRPDIFLKMQYGDYMKLPPRHMQIAHKLKRWSVDLAGSKEKESETKV